MCFLSNQKLEFYVYRYASCKENTLIIILISNFGSSKRDKNLTSCPRLLSILLPSFCLLICILKFELFILEFSFFKKIYHNAIWRKQRESSLVKSTAQVMSLRIWSEVKYFQVNRCSKLSFWLKKYLLVPNKIESW